MKERPIIMSSESVRAILEGRKTQTRRVMQKQPECEGVSISTEGGDMVYIWPHEAPIGDPRDYVDHYCKSPYGRPGDRLWVRESFTYITLAENEQRDARTPDGVPVRMLYKSDADAEGWTNQCRWYPPIHMPRWASRITLEIVKVRVQRVWQISQWDCIQEGIVDVARAEHRSPEPGEAPIDLYGKLWDRINAKRGYPWSSNPWVWVIEFRRTS